MKNHLSLFVNILPPNMENLREFVLLITVNAVILVRLSRI